MGRPKAFAFYYVLKSSTLSHSSSAASYIANHPPIHRNIHLQGLVIAGLGDLKRPVQTLSVKQSGALAMTGLIWSRYSLVIKPINYNLFAVNFFVALSGLYQISRVIRYHRSLEGKKGPGE